MFDRWLSNDVELTDATAPSTTFVMPNHAVTVTATYRDRADTSALDKLIQEASKLTEGKYTAASWEKLENAKEAAQAVLENLATVSDLEVHLIISAGAERVLQAECGIPSAALARYAHAVHESSDMAAGPSSGSWHQDGMKICT